MKHQKISCHGQLEHWENATHDHYLCIKCGLSWKKRKRQAAQGISEVFCMEYPETHQQGNIEICNLEQINGINLYDADLGVQISADGRVWVCINGIAFIRFKPEKRGATTRFKGILYDD